MPIPRLFLRSGFYVNCAYTLARDSEHLFTEINLNGTVSGERQRFTAAYAIERTQIVRSENFFPSRPTDARKTTLTPSPPYRSAYRRKVSYAWNQVSAWANRLYRQIEAFQCDINIPADEKHQDLPLLRRLQRLGGNVEITGILRNVMKITFDARNTTDASHII